MCIHVCKLNVCVFVCLFVFVYYDLELSLLNHCRPPETDCVPYLQESCTLCYCRYQVCFFFVAFACIDIMQ